MIASDITKGRMMVLPQDIKEYGLDPDKLVIADAVRMSMSIPYFYKPFRFGQSYVVDGGLLSNFPVWLFDSEGIPEWPTFGFKLSSKADKIPHPNAVIGPITMLKAMFFTMLEAHDIQYEEDANTVRSIGIDTSDVGTTEFDLSKEKVAALYQSGHQAAETFFKSWDFQKYIKQYRMAATNKP